MMNTRSKVRIFLRERGFIPRIPMMGQGIAFKQAWLKIKPIEGWLASPHQEQWLFEAAHNLPKTANILEIGSFKGRSTISMALGCLGTGRRVFAVDTFRGNKSDFVRGQNEVEWDGDSFFSEFTANLEKTGVRTYVVPLVGASQEIAHFWKAPIDLLFVDGSHVYADILADWENFFPHVVSGGIVAFHDVTPEWDGPYRVWNQVIKPRLKNIGFVTTLAYGIKP